MPSFRSTECRVGRVSCFPNDEFLPSVEYRICRGSSSHVPSLPIVEFCQMRVSSFPSAEFCAKCDVCQMPSLPSAKFFAKCKISPNTEFAECKIWPNAEFDCVLSFSSANFLSAEFATCRVFPSAQFFRLLWAEFAKSRVLSNARFCRVTACRRLPAVTS